MYALQITDHCRLPVMTVETAKETMQEHFWCLTGLCARKQQAKDRLIEANRRRRES